MSSVRISTTRPTSSSRPTQTADPRPSSTIVVTSSTSMSIEPTSTTDEPFTMPTFTNRPTGSFAPPRATNSRNISNQEQQQSKPAGSLGTIFAVMGVVVLLSMIGIYIFRKTTLRKSSTFRNRLKPHSSFDHELGPVTKSTVPKLEEYMPSQTSTPKVLPSSYAPSEYSNSTVGYQSEYAQYQPSTSGNHYQKRSH